MSKGNTFENDLLQLIFHGTAIANLADNAASSPLTELYVSLHTGDPGEGGSQTTNETAYTGYARVAVPRSSSGWTITGNSASPTSTIEFGECTGSPGDPITHFAVGTATTGTGKILYKGSISPTITMAAGIIPRIKTTSTITED